MTIDSKDFKTLLVRVALVTAALRLVPMFTADLGPQEASLALGVARDGLASDWAARMLHAWAAGAGGVGAFVRAPTLLCEVALPLLAVGFARVAGWGSLAGLFVGLALSLGPLAMQSGHRLGGAAAVALAALLALLWLRGGLRDGERKRVLASAGLLAAAGALWSPVLLVVPAGLYMAWRAVADDRLRLQAAGAWMAAAAVALGARAAALGYLLPEPDLAAAAWMADAAAEPSGWAHAGVGGAWQALLAVLPTGAIGSLASQLDLQPSPAWNLALGAAIVVAALWGWLRGMVQPDPPPLMVQRRPLMTTDDDEETADQGAGARDGWRSLGVGLPVVPRELGDRDWGPPLVALLAVAAFCAQASLRGKADGLAEALAVGRVAAAILVGAGLAALATPKSAAARAGEEPVRRRAYTTLGIAALALFGAGAWHLLVQTSAPERMAARKVARYAKDNGEDPAVVGAGKAAFLAVGARGLPVAALLDPSGTWPQLRLARGEAGDVQAQLFALLAKEPMAVAVFGDAVALGSETTPSADQAAIAASLDETLTLAQFDKVPESHRYLGATAVMIYARSRGSDPGTVRPQLRPGVPP